MANRALLVLATWCVAPLVLSTACAPRINAQVANGPPPDHECRVLAANLASNPHSEAFRQALRSNIAACGETGAEAIATALRLAKADPDPDLADRFRFIVAYNRSQRILDAVLEVAEDHGASIQMRIVAIEGALRQHVLDSAFGETSEVLAARPMGRFCQIVFVEHADQYKSAAVLGTNARELTVSRLRRIADDQASPQSVRDAARCAADHITPRGGGVQND